MNRLLDKELRKYYKSNYPMRESIVYILTNKEHTYYYVGTTMKSVEERYYMRNPNKFQREHNINLVYKIYPVPNKFYAYEYEQVIFDLLVRMIGKDNVRGAYLTMFELPGKGELYRLRKCHIEGLCFNCERKGHMVRHCPEKIDYYSTKQDKILKFP